MYVYSDYISLESKQCLHQVGVIHAIFDKRVPGASCSLCGLGGGRGVVGVTAMSQVPETSVSDHGLLRTHGNSIEPPGKRAVVSSTLTGGSRVCCAAMDHSP